MKLTINSIQREDIFCAEYANLVENNVIDFSKKNIAVLYGPNGTGKTSLALALNQDKGTKYSVQIDQISHTEKDEKFAHVICDQNGRNIIAGSTEDFILGDNIKREYELKRKIETGFRELFETKISGTLKNSFGISTKSFNSEALILNTDLKNFASDLANIKSKGKGIERERFIAVMETLNHIDDHDHDEEKFKYFASDYNSKSSIIKKLAELKISLIQEEKELKKIEESGDAVRILEKYDYLDDCVVCDSEITRETLLSRKKELNTKSIQSLSEQAKLIVQEIIEKVDDSNAFSIRTVMKNTLASGKPEEFEKLIKEINLYKIIYNHRINNLFYDATAESGLITIYSEYKKIVIEKPEFESEDIIFIEQFLSENLGRKIELSRDADQNLRLLLGEKEFLNMERSSLMLSNGEQNFLSLAFELLKAKKVEQLFVVLDDPISSFDSIYKNKIAYAIIRFLSNKKIIVLTHNTDLIKLLEHQSPNSFSLFFLNNTPDEVNGLIPITTKETKLLIYLHELINFLRGDVAQEILNEKAFLISIIPFMRGYCQITNNTALKNELTQLMHGYKSEVVNVSKIYRAIFGNDVIQNEHEISAADIIEFNMDGISILRSEEYPLLNKTLIHTLNYLYLRLCVESKLVKKFGINIKTHDMLSSIILASFNNTTTDESRKNRAFFLSRKTLLNEFNHFEVDMNIFQPAIDITNKALHKERTDILQRLSEL